MKRFKLIFICMIVLMLLLCFSAGCVDKSISKTHSVDNESSDKISFVDTNNQLEITDWNTEVYVDPITGVNYLVNSWTGDLTERYNADGTLFVSEVVK